VVEKDQLRAATRVLTLWAVYQDIEDLVNIGAYAPGVNLEFDLAVQMRPQILNYLKQDSRAPVTLEQAKKQLMDLMGVIDHHERLLKVAAQAKVAAAQRQAAATAK
jgi:flagellar biosynthesis/type III secretory pathway ATPase